MIRRRHWQAALLREAERTEGVRRGSTRSRAVEVGGSLARLGRAGFAREASPMPVEPQAGGWANT